MGKKKPRPDADAPDNAANFKVNPFAALSAAKLVIPAEPPPPQPPAPPPAPAPGAKLSPADRELLQVFKNASLSVGGDTPGAPATRLGGPLRGRVRLQVQRKGKGGKTVTRVLGLADLSVKDQMELACELRQALGTGAHFDEDTLELHGDLRDRAAEWFRKHNYAIA
ncbi:MAG: hypothetical protein A3K19_23700 [Lentisphaerae bacterium RIFOXYB12_FULL_65_16]|nr:MAG: hypothetical protein A3K18_18695 [Lentisphaerae bacterium RIFOXYA12_64_32]OGV94115.1 MAG: hypothetical protein A3K19_23700 [Lentisphaerae bacterium RIFOXYB12_FULL_65_16]